MLLLAALAAAATADRAWIFVIDGLRESEGVGAGAQNMPFLWDDARARGTLVTGVINRGTTQTDAAHRMALTGRRQPTGGMPWYPGRVLNRAFTPTVFEAVGQARGLDLDGGYINGNTVFMDSQARSLYPGLGSVGAREFPEEEDSGMSDIELAKRLRSWLEDHDPKVMLLNLHEADKNGHAALWEPYNASVLGADRIVESFASDLITDNDAVFVFADHGRHLDDNWKGHTDICMGCRTSFLIAWGPGIEKGKTIEGGWELDDIGPTIAAVMGTTLPLSRGRVITPLLTDAPAIPDAAKSLVDPELVRGNDGTLHLFAERLRNAAEGEGITHQVSSDEGRTWVTLDDVALGLGSTQPEELRAVAYGERILLSWRAWREESGTWSVWTSEGDKNDWSEPEMADTDVFHYTVGAIGVDPATQVPHGWWWSELIGISDPTADLIHATQTGTVDTAGNPTWTSTTVLGDKTYHLPLEWALHALPAGLIATFVGIPDEDYFEGNDNREIYVMTGAETEAPTVVRVSTGKEPSYWPSLARTDDGTLHLAWVDREGASVDEGGWRLRYATSGTSGASWSEPVSLEVSGEAWRPTLYTSGDDVALAFTQITGADHKLRTGPIVGGVLGELTTLSAGAAVDRVAAQPITDGSVLVWGEAESTDSHTVHTARVGPDGTLLEAPEDTGEEAADSDVGVPDRRCGCEGSGALVLLPGLALLRRRRPHLG